MTSTRPVFFEGQMLTAADLNALSEYCASETQRLRIACVTATLIAWVAALVAIAADRTRRSACGR
jgi:hypothetical protein